MLVLSETKVEVLQSLDYSLNCTCDDFISEITITDMKCHLNSAEQNRSANLFYLLILRHHDAVHASRIVKPNKQGLLDFGGSYIFRDTPNTSEIKAELFAIKLNNSIMKGLTRFFAKKSSQTLPLMTFVGEATIGLENATNGTFFIRFMVENEWKSHLLTATVDIKKDQPALASTSIQNKLQHISPNKGKKN
ncbi:hypothetical protein GWI33_010877 [Rhynchophorus ferrugineus]|uniref:Uncharacterized protein n=1 Tax=Rhynchophorus ferrugineus TaxID=354439 RepID=A0A834ILF9_RHYFE|nr:hypothetical protein GWI33_010877 [Rhynchophorus ferrugineus]